MRSRPLTWLALATSLWGLAPIAAQQPTAEQVQARLRQSPDLAAALRAQIQASGLSVEQIRARLAASGYPPNLLDPYLVGPTTPGPPPSEQVSAAVRALGLTGLESEVAVAEPAAAAPSDTTGPGELRRFGTEVFRRATSQFQPMLAGPVDRNYRLGPGDYLVLILSGDVELTHQLEVTREGFVVIPQVGQLFVSGLTLGQLEDLLYTRLGRVYSGVRRGPGATTQFQVTVTRLRVNQVFVLGDVVRPGSYVVSAAGTMLTALYAAGGPHDNGSFRAVQLRRGGQVIDTLDLYDYLLRGDNSRDLRLETGDVVFVPVRGTLVTVRGRVVRPGIYELKPGETLREVIASAGGFDEAALRRRIQIERILPPAQRRPGGRDRVVLDLDAASFTAEEAPAFPLEPGDEVRVFEVADRRRSYVTVRGNVWNEGLVGLTPGMRLSDAIRVAGGPKPDVYLGQILVSRLRADSTRVQLRAVFADSLGTVRDDLLVNEDDEIRIFSRTDFRPERWVAVTGAVRQGGRVPYREGMTLRDAVLLASGLTEDAWLGEAEVARLPAERTPGVLAETVRVPLDSTYLVDRDPSGRYLGPPGLPAPAGRAAEIPLRPYDNVLILRQPEWELHRTVNVTGQVRYPGEYALRSRGERLTDLLARAGGLTQQAYPAGVAFYRRSPAIGRIGVDLPTVMEDPTHRENLVLASGDSIHVPEYSPVVRVEGAVNAPGAVAYVPGRDLDYYVYASGGYSRRADRGRAFVTQPSGKLESVQRRFLLPDGKPNPHPGAVVTVPAREPEEKKEVASIIGSIAQALASAVAIIVVVTR